MCARTQRPRVAACVLFLVGVAAQSSVQQFEWGFPKDTSTQLPACGTLPISALPAAKQPVPPFYMISFAAGSTPVTEFVGTNASALQWTVRHPVGSQLILEVVDSQGTSGGLDVPLYTVIAGATTDCIPAVPNPSFKITSSTSNGGTINTCDPWTLFISGGAPPYSVTVAALNTPDVTNVTMGPTDTVFQYINRAHPDSQMIAAISDSSGRWATGSPLVHTSGSTDTTCPGQSSLSGTNSTIPGLESNSGTTPPSTPGQTTVTSTVSAGGSNPPPTSPGSSPQTSSPPAGSGSPQSQPPSSSSDALLGLTQSSTSAVSSSPSGPGSLTNTQAQTHSTQHTLIIIGASVGGAVVALALLILCGCYWRRKRQRTRAQRKNTMVSEFSAFQTTTTAQTAATMTATDSRDASFMSSPSPRSPLQVTPFLLPDSGSRWSKPGLMSPTSPADSASTLLPAVINERELPPPYVHVEERTR
ncbi:hypothetical protein C8F01DRAFT_144115 [Mycena amicta]|nr:hypothetical protein C8F01DRAFT_144115 [Mycena amicta]